MSDTPRADTALFDRIGEPGRCFLCGTERGDSPHIDCATCSEWGPPCLRCGERGTYPDGDENDCRSVSCTERRMAE